MSDNPTGPVRVHNGAGTWLLLQPPERHRVAALCGDGESIRGYVDGVERPELVQFIPAGWHPPLELPPDGEGLHVERIQPSEPPPEEWLGKTPIVKVSREELLKLYPPPDGEGEKP